jgi:hypothetical protein
MRADTRSPRPSDDPLREQLERRARFALRQPLQQLARLVRVCPRKVPRAFNARRAADQVACLEINECINIWKRER